MTAQSYKVPAIFNILHFASVALFNSDNNLLMSLLAEGRVNHEVTEVEKLCGFGQSVHPRACVLHPHHPLSLSLPRAQKPRVFVV